MGKETMFGDIDIENHKSHCYKNPIFFSKMKTLITY